MKNLLILWDLLPNKNNWYGHFWIYASLYVANNGYFIDKDEHVIKIKVNITCIILMYLKIVSIYDTNIVNVHKSLVIQNYTKIVNNIILMTNKYYPKLYLHNSFHEEILLNNVQILWRLIKSCIIIG